MNQLIPNPTSEPVTNPHTEKIMENITVAHTFANTVIAGEPAFVTVHDNNYVAISVKPLSDLLRALYDAGVRRVVIVIDAAGLRLAAEVKVYRRSNRRSGRMHFWPYSLQLRSLCSATCFAGTVATLRTTPRDPCR
ncbi:MAG: hypothetical protein ACO2PM_12225 [Pyrobaculum sp.]|jgi:hypothetical protein